VGGDNDDKYSCYSNEENKGIKDGVSLMFRRKKKKRSEEKTQDKEWKWSYGRDEKDRDGKGGGRGGRSQKFLCDDN
jgi:hypothetical protein